VHGQRSRIGDRGAPPGVAAAIWREEDVDPWTSWEDADDIPFVSDDDDDPSPSLRSDDISDLSSSLRSDLVRVLVVWKYVCNAK